MILLTAIGWAWSCTWKKARRSPVTGSRMHRLRYQQKHDRGTELQLISRGLTHRHISLLQQLKSCFWQTTEATRQGISRSWHSELSTWGIKTPVVLADGVFFVNPFLDRPSKPSKGPTHLLGFILLNTNCGDWNGLLHRVEHPSHCSTHSTGHCKATGFQPTSPRPSKDQLWAFSAQETNGRGPPYCHKQIMESLSFARV